MCAFRYSYVIKQVLGASGAGKRKMRPWPAMCMQAVQAARTDDEVTAAVAANNPVAERAAEADDATPRRVFADLVKRLEPLLDRARCCILLAWQAGVHVVRARGGAPLRAGGPAAMARQVASRLAAL